jgi:hypothetical protein
MDELGIEPKAFRMRNGRSTTELHAHVQCVICAASVTSTGRAWCSAICASRRVLYVSVEPARDIHNIGTIQRRLAWSLRKVDTLIEKYHFFNLPSLRGARFFTEDCVGGGPHNGRFVGA